MLEYVAKFTELARFRDHYMATYIDKVWMFEDGLKLSIRGKIVGFHLQDMDSMVRTTMAIEREIEDARSIRDSGASYKRKEDQPCHTSIPGLTRLADPNRVRGTRLYTGTLYLFFFLRVELVPVGTQTISVITKIIYINKRTTGVVSIKIYTHIPSPIYKYKICTFTFTNQSAEPTCSEPLLVCWPISMRKLSYVFLLYLHGLKTRAKLYA